IKHNRVHVYQDKRYRYDRFGRLSEKRTGSNRIQRFEYDAEHRLIGVHQQNGALRQRVVFGYDPLGRRISKQVYHDNASEPSHRTLFHWQGLRLLEEVQDGRPSLYVYADPGSYEPLARVDGKLGSEAIFYFHTNLAGLPEQLTDAGGKTVWHSEYRAWGRTRDEWHDQQAGSEQNLRFQGQYLDRETGLHYNTFRFFDPDIGRFTQPDPIGLAGGINLYVYAPNAFSWIDPWGLANLNSNTSTGNFGVYKIEINGELYKYGKADLNRITKSSGLPTRLHQQVRMHQKKHGIENVVGRVIETGHPTTAAAKIAETARLDDHYKKTNEIPEGNRKSYKPKSNTGCPI
ncbi:RHS repeat domain-containing protein, partial [Pseudomonas marginalis]|uniref:RHS repeat domain-containing protein n=1 Tax=Pseudomonas marginalis TaxID=298 RepID=UPI0034D5C842